MNLLFDHKYKRISGWVFYLSLPLAAFVFITGKFNDILVFRVYLLFSFNRTVVTHGTENVIGSEGFRWLENGLVDEILVAMVIVSGIVNSFSRERIEDELIGKIRTASLTASLYVNYGLVLLANFLIYDLTFIYVLVFHLFAILLLFNLIFRYRLKQLYTDRL